MSSLHNLRKLRIASQTVFFLLFLFLLSQTEYHGREEIAYPVKIFLDIDPLILVSTFLSAHKVAGTLLFALITLVLTAILGRFFCAWICPLGTLNDCVGSFKKRGEKEARTQTGRALKLKYYLLIALLVVALFGIQLVGFLDPLSITVRSFSLAINPAINFITHNMFNFIYTLDIDNLSRLSESIFNFLRLHVISFGIPVFAQGSFIGFIFLTILGLNFVHKRFWCRFICPLGALLAVSSRFSVLNHKLDINNCNECMLCLNACAGGGRDEPHSQWRGSECVLCLNCLDACSKHAITFKFGRPDPALHRTDLKRRRMIEASLYGLGSLALLRLSPSFKRGNAGLIRPPGSTEEKEFLSKCIKCGECMKVCITNGLQPTFLQAGLEGMWSPVFDFRVGYCEFNCTLCGQVCPTGAIERLDIATKRKRKIGLAFIDENRCLPYAFNISCIVCEEYCPTSPKAIFFEEKTVKSKEGDKKIKLPRVDPKICTGCGICEYKCPVGTKAAIRMSSIGEERSERNRLFL